MRREMLREEVIWAAADLVAVLLCLALLPLWLPLLAWDRISRLRR